jgi:hypothetical protein
METTQTRIATDIRPESTLHLCYQPTGHSQPASVVSGTATLYMSRRPRTGRGQEQPPSATEPAGHACVPTTRRGTPCGMPPVTPHGRVQCGPTHKQPSRCQLSDRRQLSSPAALPHHPPRGMVSSLAASPQTCAPSVCLAYDRQEQEHKLPGTRHRQTAVGNHSMHAIPIPLVSLSLTHTLSLPHPHLAQRTQPPSIYYIPSACCRPPVPCPLPYAPL